MALIDANVALELILPNRQKVAQVTEILGNISEPCISTLSAHLIWHFARLERIRDAVISDHIAAYQLLSLTAADYAWALRNERGKDFEDALQVAVALNSGCQQFVTLDRQLARRYAHEKLQFVIPR
ncbi:MAG: type II toxin-antitoxin system VapC family toxin [Candidatus Saccharimonadales bacterium]